MGCLGDGSGTTLARWDLYNSHDLDLFVEKDL